MVAAVFRPGLVEEYGAAGVSQVTVQALEIPSSALVVLIGAAGSGKSTFARTHFRVSEILSSDFFRGMVSDDEGNQEATGDAFDLLHLALEKRLRRGKLCVVDATNVRTADRARLLALAQRYARAAVAIVIDTPESIAIQRAADRADRIVEAEIVKRQLAELRRGLEDMKREGFAKVFMWKPGDHLEIRRTGC